MNRTRTVAALLTLMALAVGCGPGAADGTTKKEKTTMNMQQGAERADAILQETLGAVKPELLWNHGSSGDAGCTNAVGGATGTGAANRSILILTIVSPQRRGALLGIIERAWKDRGYTITSVNPSETFPAIFASTPDGYSLSVEVAGEGQFFLEAATPCLTDHPVQEPTSKPNTPVRTTPYPQRPDVQDEFWSATTPLPSGSPTP
ncbi:hypothetical protein KPP03845_104311 [Streptomyces xanthophaeus]|uniref:hypothetical protein n=1 Tax=Streptomyces xanthophaeus TaxID=67385 RepID=UPI00233F4F18|nr:hypothetical protein [Streptomyces xanthophaeus]WCD87910.1 hypothetical protein KPP03845_104311 [Streptomyces xanthophaeus]